MEIASRDLCLRLAKLARRAGTRSHIFTRTAPTHWEPTSILNPRTGLCFTDASAWDFIADLLENNHAFQTIVLDQPPGQLALTTTFTLGKSVVYIKVQEGKGHIIGRSFHLSELP